ncbi:hypothetical protein KC614_02280 [candidate division WWE3 bacterium]|uniref:SD-repeat containing protein B domain-containing protein n=1 Tax=candidate division WWE3 bacterium TaxID=2053526 RepID=A0A955LKR2_UNCKA|nr:hypothetical protein [candidate division WWE3 bacterium]
MFEEEAIQINLDQEGSKEEQIAKKRLLGMSVISRFITLILATAFFFAAFISLGSIIGYTMNLASQKGSLVIQQPEYDKWEGFFSGLTFDAGESPESALQITFFVDSNGNQIKDENETLYYETQISIIEEGSAQQTGVVLSSNNGTFNISSLPNGSYEAELSYSYDDYHKQRPIYTDGIGIVNSYGSKGLKVAFDIPAANQKISVGLQEYKPKHLLFTTNQQYRPTGIYVYDVDFGVLLFSTRFTSSDLIYGYNANNHTVYYLQGNAIYGLAPTSVAKTGEDYIDDYSANIVGNVFWVSDDGNIIAHKTPDPSGYRFVTKNLTTSSLQQILYTNSTIKPFDSDYSVFSFKQDSKAFLLRGSAKNNSGDTDYGWFYSDGGTNAEYLYSDISDAAFYDDSHLVFRMSSDNTPNTTIYPTPEEGSDSTVLGEGGIVLYDLQTKTARPLVNDFTSGYLNFSPYGHYAVRFFTDGSSTSIDYLTIAGAVANESPQVLRYDMPQGFRVATPDDFVWDDNEPVFHLTCQSCQDEKSMYVKFYDNGTVKKINVADMSYGKIIGYYEE